AKTHTQSVDGRKVTLHQSAQHNGTAGHNRGKALAHRPGVAKRPAIRKAPVAKHRATMPATRKPATRKPAIHPASKPTASKPTATKPVPTKLAWLTTNQLNKMFADERDTAAKIIDDLRATGYKLLANAQPTQR
ncbi:MAG: hypothetical protein M3387_00980, partial [Actinomycetota bacterium]|nr:hypothetical protein [Actinomycetota bacterium]